MIFLLDNYDSFTYNLYQMLKVSGARVEVARNDRTTVEEVVASKPAALVLSPGPGRPENAGVMLELIAATAGKVPMLGVCLGMQAIGMHFGAKVVQAATLMHGKTCHISHNGKGMFKGLPESIEVMRYHSLVVDELPEAELEITATGPEEEPMAFRHKELAVEAAQFHPESFATEHGMAMLESFLDEHKAR